MFLELPNVTKLNKALNDNTTSVKIVNDQQENSNDLFIEIALKDLRKVFDYDNYEQSIYHVDQCEVRFSPQSFKPIYVVNHRNSKDMDCNGNNIVSFTLTNLENENEVYKKDTKKVYFLLDQNWISRHGYMVDQIAKHQENTIDESDRILFGCITKQNGFWDCDFTDFVKEKVLSHVKFCGYDLDKNFKIVKWSSKKFDSNLCYKLDQLNNNNFYQSAFISE